ncbi:RHS repeat-associated core domain-containing protein [Pseudescherichia sp.]|uniref:RHS repeat-associated core domain-containing protein n=1 Tax=Pseudescherichia sp. TaxID=2055881 RepID=UPI0028A20009|nr:RHS repeat-associated core domain-containing protein [Pseudescherichia sp.]
MSLQLLGVNQNNSTLLAYDGSSQQVNLYSAFGNSNNSANSTLPGYNGERQDPLTGVSHLGNGYRAYNPILMRFNCPDSESPFGVGGINSYAYCENDPVNFSDPSGHGIFTWFVAGIAALLRYVMADGIAESVAVVVGKTARYTLTYGTQISSALTNYTAYVVAGNNPQAAMRLEKASYALGTINAVSTLYSSYHKIFKNISSLRTNRSLDKFMKVIKKSTTKVDEFGNIRHTPDDIVQMFDERNAGNHIIDRAAAVAENIVEQVFDIEINQRTLPESIEHGLNNTKLTYEMVGATMSLSSTVFSIISESIRKKYPQTAEELSFVSSGFGNIDLGMHFFSNLNNFKGKLKWGYNKGNEFIDYVKFKKSILKLDSSSGA